MKNYLAACLHSAAKFFIHHSSLNYHLCAYSLHLLMYQVIFLSATKQKSYAKWRNKSMISLLNVKKDVSLQLNYLT